MKTKSYMIKTNKVTATFSANNCKTITLKQAQDKMFNSCLKESSITGAEIHLDDI